MFDELTHFSRSQFFYMLSRNRSMCGIKPYVRATCNPDPDSWVREFIDWWIDPYSGYPLPERSGKLRWFFRENDQLNWADSKDELCERFDFHTPEQRIIPKSVTFIGSKLTDNQILLRRDPAYLANLMALGTVEREQLLNGNWNIRAQAGIFSRDWWREYKEDPRLMSEQMEVIIHSWDLTFKETKDAHYVVGQVWGKNMANRYLLDQVRAKMDFPATLKAVRKLKEKWPRVRKIFIEDKANGPAVISTLQGEIPGIIPVDPAGGKIGRANAVSAQIESGNVYLPSSFFCPWVTDFIDEFTSFPTGVNDDMVDAGTQALIMLTDADVPRWVRRPRWA